MEYGERQQKRRFVVLTAIFSGALGLLVVNLFWLQIVKGGEFTRRARTVSERETPLPAQRGEIFDRRGDDPLVFNVDSFSIDLAPGEVPSARLPGPVRPAFPGAFHTRERHRAESAAAYLAAVSAHRDQGSGDLADRVCDRRAHGGLSGA